MKDISIIDSYRDEIVKSMQNMIEIKSISPQSGGMGESERANFLEGILKNIGVHTKRYEYIDNNNIKRPSIIAKIGNCKKTLWIIAHIDTVSEGDINMWRYNPFKGTIVGNKIYGRGTNDDGQDVIAAIFALKAIIDTKVELNYNYGLALVADEELGSAYGIRKLLNEDIFKADDIILVPDGGSATGDEVEIAEKSLLWLKITATGKQVHASTPELGKNALRTMMKFLNLVDAHLHEKYNLTDESFSPNKSTFEMTKHEKNQDSINMIPGTEIFYIDCRILPIYNANDVLNDVIEIANKISDSTQSIKVETFVREDSAGQTSPNSEIVKLTSNAIKNVIGITPKAIGIGGGTFASFFRRMGIDAVVWSKKPDIPHIIDEYVIIDDILTDAKVFYFMASKQ